MRSELCVSNVNIKRKKGRWIHIKDVKDLWKKDSLLVFELEKLES